jgi:hypothetical protein
MAVAAARRGFDYFVGKIPACPSAFDGFVYTSSKRLAHFCGHEPAESLFLTVENVCSPKKVFVHCRVGDRTGMDIAAYRMAEQGWAAEEAKRQMAAYGVNWFHRIICLRLSSYEESFTI